MTKVYIDYSSFNMEALHEFVFKLTGKRAKTYPLAFPLYIRILIDEHDDHVYLLQGKEIKEGTVHVSLSEALTYIREQVFIQSLEN